MTKLVNHFVILVGSDKINSKKAKVSYIGTIIFTKENWNEYGEADEVPTSTTHARLGHNRCEGR